MAWISSPERSNTRSNHLRSNNVRSSYLKTDNSVVLKSKHLKKKLNLSLNQLKVIAKIKGIRGYESMSKDANQQEVKDHDVDKSEINKTIRE